MNKNGAQSWHWFNFLYDVYMSICDDVFYKLYYVHYSQLQVLLSYISLQPRANGRHLIMPQFLTILVFLMNVIVSSDC